MNQLILVGRLVDDPKVKEFESGKKVTNITIACTRPFKNIDGEYESDFIDITLWNGVAERTSEYCKKGDIISIKGRIQNNNYEKDGEMKYEYQIIGEKISFLASKENFKSTNEQETER